jgi:hypothetical protein
VRIEDGEWQSKGSSSKLHLTAEYYYYYRNKRKLFANDEKCKGKKKKVCHQFKADFAMLSNQQYLFLLHSM